MSSYLSPFADFGSFLGDPFTQRPGLSLQELLMDMFSNRENIFAPTSLADQTFPFFKELTGGGLEWSYDPNWLTGIPRPRPESSGPSIFDVVTGGGGRRGGHDVHGRPAQDPIEFDGDLTAPPPGPPWPRRQPKTPLAL